MQRYIKLLKNQTANYKSYKDRNRKNISDSRTSDTPHIILSVNELTKVETPLNKSSPKKVFGNKKNLRSENLKVGPEFHN